MRLVLGILALAFFLSSRLGAVGHDHSKCAHGLGALKPLDIKVTGSGSQAFEKELPNRREMFEEVYGTAVRLGLTIPPTTVHFHEPVDMAALLATGAHPVPHSHDGAKVLAAAAQAASVYEFIWPGQPRHHQYYRSINDWYEDARVAGHTVGHMHFGEVSQFQNARKADPISRSLKLAKEVGDSYLTVDHDETARFYQLILSLLNMQDFRRGSYQSPSDFENPVLNRKTEFSTRTDGVSKKYTAEQTSPRHPSAPTPSILQAMVKNLPNEWPEQFSKILELFEGSFNAFPWVSQTKFMNEGFSVFCEWFVLKHSKYNTPSDAVEFSRVSGASWSRSLTNPYWLGSQAWFRIYERFMERDEIKALPTVFERDQKFVLHANEIIRTHNDFQFIRFALDDRFIAKQKLFLYRENEASWFLPPTETCVTVDPKRVIDYIAHKVLNPDIRMPWIELKDFNEKGAGRAVFVHNAERRIPLNRPSTVKTLYVLSQILRRPVTIETVASRAWAPATYFNVGNFWPPFPPFPYPPYPPYPPQEPVDELETWPMKVTVDPTGKIEISYDEKDQPAWVKDLNLVPGFEKALANYRLDLSMSYSRDLKEIPSSQLLNQMFSASIAPLVGQVPAMKMNSPTAPEAVLEYDYEVKHRLHATLQLLLKGKWAYQMTGAGIGFRILPEVPSFELDRRIMRKRGALLPKTPIDSYTQVPKSTGKAPDYGKIPDEDLDIGSGDRQPGDTWMKPPPGEGGNGEGEEGDEGDDEGEGEGAGEGGGGEGQIRIPIEQFAEVLVEELQLRNLRQTDGGDITEEQEIRMGSVQRDSGDPIPEETAVLAMKKAMAVLHQQGKNPMSIPPEDLIRIGLEHQTPEDIVSADRDVVEVPEKRAVLVIARDASGSMSTEHIKIIDEFLVYTEAVLKTVYPSVEFVYILASDEAEEVSRKKFFSQHMGGGTQMNKAVMKQKEIMDARFPREQYNRFPFLFSDGDDFFPDETIAEVNKLIPDVELYGYGHVDPQGTRSSFNFPAVLSQKFKDLRDQNRKMVGYAELTRNKASVFNGLKEFFGEPDESSPQP